MSAVFSPCRTWRYTLTRTFAPATLPLGVSYGRGNNDPSLRTVAFIGLNPSTADETKDDPTVRRCVRYAQRWGFERMVMLNAFAHRSTDPKALLLADDPVGPENDMYVLREVSAADLVVCAWGTWVERVNDYRAYALPVLLRGKKLHVLGLTKDGHPKHPLYLKADLEPVEWLLP